MQRLVIIVKEIWDFHNKLNEPEFLYEFNKFFNKDGMVLFCLKAMLNRNQDI